MRINLAISFLFMALILPLCQAQQVCSDYHLITIRGTLEPQGPSIALNSVTDTVMDELPNGTTYDVVYPANIFQDVNDAVDDALRELNNKIEQCDDTQFALLGYSQGASAVLETLERLSVEATEKVDAVLLLGNPYRREGLKSNAEGFGSENANGILSAIPFTRLSSDWDDSGKVLDICIEVSKR